METLWQDVRYGLRMLARSPGFTAVAVLTLALGIGANTAIFSVVEAVLLESIPYENPERLAYVVGHMYGDTKVAYPVSVPDAQDLAKDSPSIEEVSWFEDERTLTLTGREEPVRLHVNFVAPKYFELVGVAPVRGRTFLPEENLRPGAHPLAVISYSVWQGLLGGEEAVLGEQLELNGRQYTVIGVLPAGFRDLSSAQHRTDVWIPFMMASEIFPSRVLTERLYHFFGVVARLEEGAGWAAAQSEVDAISQRLGDDYPDSNKGYSMRLVPLQEQLVGGYRKPLAALLVGAGFVLLIACANVANLLLARAATRQKEMALRLALGASRGRLLRQLLTEGFLLSSLAGGLGFALAVWATAEVVQLSAMRLPAFVHVSPDLRVLLFTGLVSLVTGVAFALTPALQGSRADLRFALNQAGRQAGGGGQGGTLHRVLIAVQVATALTLLVGAGLLLQSFRQLHQTGIGFQTENTLTLRVELPSSRYPDAEALRLFARQSADALGNLPGVESAHLWGPEAPGQSRFYIPMVEEGRLASSIEEGILTRIHHVTPGSLRQLGFRFLYGRDLSEEDRANTTIVAVVSKSLADKMWPGQDPVGRRYHSYQGPRWYTVVGVVDDAQLGGRITPDAANRFDVFYSLEQRPRREVTILIRARTDAVALAPSVRATLQELDANLPPYDVMSMQERLGFEEAKLRFTSWLAVFFAALALFLAALGLYAILAYVASRRTQEIGIRMALGARPLDIFWLVVGGGFLPTAAGMLVGLVGALALTRFLSSLLFGVSPLDPVIYLSVVALFAVVAFWASYLPARRATRVDPMVALRYE
ncbi:MAG: ABC transporter permease [Terriglobia bacterium]